MVKFENGGELYEVAGVGLEQTMNCGLAPTAAGGGGSLAGGNECDKFATGNRLFFLNDDII